MTFTKHCKIHSNNHLKIADENFTKNIIRIGEIADLRQGTFIASSCTIVTVKSYTRLC